MLFYIFIYVFLGVQPMLSIYANDFPHGNQIMTSNLTFYTISLILIGILFFEIGYSINIRFSLDRIIKNRPTPNFLKKSKRLILIIIILFFIAIKVYGPYIFLGIRDGGLDLGNFEGKQRSQIEDLLVIYGLRTIAALLLFFSIIKYNKSKDHKFKTSLKRLLLIIIFINLIISNPLNAPRLWSGSILLTALFLFLPWNKKTSFANWSFFGCLILLLLFSGTDPRRIIGKQLIMNNEITLTNTITELKSSIEAISIDANFDTFQVISMTIMYTEKNGFSIGNQLLLPALFWIPRSIWSNKPIGTPDLVASSFDLPNLNISAPLWAEGYINFGILGVVIFFLILGIFSRKSDEIIQYGNRYFSLIVSTFFASNLFILLRGDLTSGTLYLQLMTVFSYLLYKYYYKIDS